MYVLGTIFDNHFAIFFGIKIFIKLFGNEILIKLFYVFFLFILEVVTSVKNLF